MTKAQFGMLKLEKEMLTECLQEKLGEDWAPHAQRLVYEGKALQKNDDKLQEAYGVESGATFQLSKSKVQVRLVNASVV